jgi:Transglutaminase-like superfamily
MPAAIRLGWAVQKTLRVLPLDTKCPIRSLVLLRLLATRGYKSALVIGVCAHPTFGAHAWIEANGIALLPTEPRFHRLTEM